MIYPQGTEPCDGNLHFLLVWIFRMFYEEKRKVYVMEKEFKKNLRASLAGCGPILTANPLV